MEICQWNWWRLRRVRGGDSTGEEAGKPAANQVTLGETDSTRVGRMGEVQVGVYVIPHRFKFNSDVTTNL